MTNLRFADDVLLFATSLSAITKMLVDVKVEAEKRGLQLHPDKTKILQNLTNDLHQRKCASTPWTLRF